MERFDRTLLALLPMALFAASCGSMRSTTASVEDDVYFMPSTAPDLASADVAPPVEEPAQQPTTDDYYDPGTSQDLGTDRSYYDITYNDPRFYNYDRFGFNSGVMGWQSGWNGPGWGGGMGWGNSWTLGMGWGYGSGIYSGWSNPYGGFNSWYSPWGWNSWGNNWGGGLGYGYGGGGYGYGGGYYGPWGSCYSCYTPVSYGDGWSNTVVAPRNGVGSGGSGIGSGTRRMPIRNPAGLAPMPNDRSTIIRNRATEIDRAVRQPATQPARRAPVTTPKHTRDESRPARNIERSSPSRGFDGGGGGRSTPAPSRDRGGGGGTRTSPGRR